MRRVVLSFDGNAQATCEVDDSLATAPHPDDRILVSDRTSCPADIVPADCSDASPGH
ncbi:hypothetical protein [Luteimonas deserti]|uniref:Uncharacterized protein n=1 Tax=Luteimonas deserti TaxID=2752306 RepID=A0A7Z0U138_9GAMM|nr:hypothetical protein [Luteimonas deserti]NYZ63938.1 hypothetical protein [Luteimonas deserti]